MIKQVVKKLAHRAGYDIARVDSGTPRRTADTGFALRGFLDRLPQLVLCDVYARILKARFSRSNIRCAVVGVDQQFFDEIEAVRDFGIQIVQHFESRPEDRWHPGKPLGMLACANHDAIFVCANEAEQEEELVARLSEIMGRQGARVPLIRISRLRAAIGRCLGQLHQQHFHTCLNPVKLVAIAILAGVTQGEGCIVECGSYLGGTGIFISALLCELKDARRVHCIDTFEGMPVPTSLDRDTIYTQGTFCDARLGEVQRHVDAHGLSQRVQLHKGLVQDRLPEILAREKKVSFALIDTDQYAGTAASLMEILPRLRANGAVIVDDSTLEGVKTAIAEAKAQHQDLVGLDITFNFQLLWNASGQFFCSGGNGGEPDERKGG